MNILKLKILPVIAIIVLCAGIFTSWTTYQKNYNEGLDDILSRVDTISALINISDIKALEGSESDLDKPEYKKIKGSLFEIVKYNRDVSFAYIMGYRNGQLYMIADSEDPQSEDYSPPGEIYYENSPALKGAFMTRKSSTEGPIRDRWGNWITGASPIKDEYGTVIAVAGIDVDALEYINSARSSALAILLGDIVIVIVIFFSYWLVRKEHASIKMREQFAAIASHEIRSPLSGLLWGINTLKRDPSVSESGKELINDMYTHGQRLMTTTHNILDTYSTEYQKVATKEVVNLGDILKEVIDTQYLTAKKNDIAIITEGNPSMAMIKADRDKVVNVFSNLIDNAIKYNKKGGKITVSYDQRSTFHRVSIRDEGLGIPKDEIEKVTSGFYRAKNVRSTDISGSGIGLFLVKKIVKNHGGTLEIESDHNGTTISVNLPVELSYKHE